MENELQQHNTGGRAARLCPTTKTMKGTTGGRMVDAIWMHGYGSTGTLMQSAIPRDTTAGGFAHLFEEAPQTCELFPDRRQWFRLSYIPHILTSYIKEQAKLVARRANANRPIVWTGHSQGAMIAAYAVLTGLTECRHAVCVSAMLPFADTIQVSPGTRLLFLHGAKDGMTPLDQLSKQIETLRTRGAHCEVKVLPDASHAFEGALAAAAFDSVEALISEVLKPCLT